MSKKISQLTTNVSPLESDLTIAVNSGETKKLTLGAALVVPHPNNLVYENISLVAKPGPSPANDAVFDTTNGTWEFIDGATETVLNSILLPNSWAEGTDILPRIHWIQSQAGTVVWRLEYKWFNKGETVPATFTAMTTTSVEYTWTSGDLQQISNFTPISGAGKTVNSTMILKYSRLGDDGADTYTATAEAISFDIRIQKDALGTRQEYTK